MHYRTHVCPSNSIIMSGCASGNLASGGGERCALKQSVFTLLWNALRDGLVAIGVVAPPPPPPDAASLIAQWKAHLESAGKPA